MSFGTAPTALGPTDFNAATLFPCSKASARNEVEVKYLLETLLRLSTSGMVFLANTPSTITSDQNNYVSGNGTFQRWSSNAARNVTGLLAPSSDTLNERREIWNVGTFPITLVHESTSSTAGNRFTCAGAANIVIGAGEVAVIQYSSTTSRWLVSKIRSDISEGTTIIRQPGGVAGTDELQLSYDGTRANLNIKDGGLRIDQNATGDGQTLVMYLNNVLVWNLERTNSDQVAMKFKSSSGAADVLAIAPSAAGAFFCANSGGRFIWTSNSNDAGYGPSIDTGLCRLSVNSIHTGPTPGTVSGTFTTTCYQLNGAPAAATSSRQILIKKTGLGDAAATSVLTISIPNGNHAASIKLRFLSSNGSTDAFESSRVAEGLVVVTRTTGVNAVKATATLEMAAIATVAAGATHTLAYSTTAISGAVGAVNSFDIQVTIDDTGGTGGNQVIVLAELINAEASGITMAAA